MPTVPELRQAGPQWLAGLLTRRPDVLAPIPPRTLQELAARLDYPNSLNLALIGLPLPALQVAEALAALGPEADRGSLAHLLGLDRPGTPPDADAALGTQLDLLAASALTVPGGFGLDPALRAAWPTPLGLQVSLEGALSRMTADDLGQVLTAWEVRRPSQRKADLQAAVRHLLTNPAKVGAALEQAPEDVREHLVAAAYGRRLMVPYTYGYSVYRPTGRPPDPLTWARQRMLLVTEPGDVWLAMPDAVAMIVRGPDWRATFTPHPPQARWRSVPGPQVEDAGTAAALNALHVAGDVLREVGRTPLKRRKDGLVGAREIRRVAKSVHTEPERLGLVLAVSHAAGLVDLEVDLVLTKVGRQWLEADPAPALAVLLEGWRTMPGMAGAGGPDGEDLSWAPRHRLGAEPVRRAVLATLAAHPGQAPEAGSLLDAVAWQIPIPFGRGLNGPLEGAPWNSGAGPDGEPGPAAGPGFEPIDELTDDDPFGPDDPDDDFPDDDDFSDADLPGQVSQDTLDDVLTEAGWLGLTGVGALTAIGHAVLAPEGPFAVTKAAEESLAPAQDEVVLQADLTATALGQPTGRLISLLDGMADRESRSAATTWRFTPASVRRALDAGDTGPDLLADLAEVSRGKLPQPLTYLITDTARQHGRLRAGTAASYVRSDDAPLLAGVAADRKLRKHGLRLLAPTVLVSTSDLPVLIAALRAAGHGPVEEGEDGTPVLRRRPRGPVTEPDAEAGGRRKIGSRRPAVEGGESATPDPNEVAARLLKGPDRAQQLIELGGTVIDISSLEDYRRARGRRT